MHHPTRRRLLAGTAALPAGLMLAGCIAAPVAPDRTTALLGALNPTTGGEGRGEQRQVASLLAYLHPGQEPPTAAPSAVTELNVPFRVGIAFVPDTASANFRLAETERLLLGQRVREAFRHYPFIQDIELVPSSFLQPGGGFDNLDRVSALLRVPVVLLVSFDQVQFSSANRWSFLYWTGLGAYVVKGERYDILTALEVSVIDVASRRLLMHAGGRSTLKGDATWVGVAERSRAARNRSFETALEELSGNLHREIATFRERAPRDPTIKLVLPPGYRAT
jgi:rhombotail lipoprotein